MAFLVGCKLTVNPVLIQNRAAEHTLSFERDAPLVLPGRGQRVLSFDAPSYCFLDIFSGQQSSLQPLVKLVPVFAYLQGRWRIQRR